MQGAAMDGGWGGPVTLKTVFPCGWSGFAPPSAHCLSKAARTGGEDFHLSLQSWKSIHSPWHWFLHACSDTFPTLSRLTQRSRAGIRERFLSVPVRNSAGCCDFFSSSRPETMERIATDLPKTAKRLACRLAAGPH